MIQFIVTLGDKKNNYGSREVHKSCELTSEYRLHGKTNKERWIKYIQCHLHMSYTCIL